MRRVIWSRYDALLSEELQATGKYKQDMINSQFNVGGLGHSF